MMHARLDRANAEETTSPNRAATTIAARQAANDDQGAADARKAEAAAPEAPWRWAPRPKPDPLKAEPEIGWKAARLTQAARRRAISAAKHNPRQLKDGGSGALLVARAQRERDAELARQACPIEQAATSLRRAGLIVYRMSVHDGDRDLWFVAGLGRDVDAARLIVEAGKRGR